MKLFSISALVLTAASFASADFQVFEGGMSYKTDSTTAPTAAELLFMDTCILEAINEVDAGGDTTTTAVVVGAPEIVERRALRKKGERDLQYGDTDWYAAVRVGGSCNFCGGGRKLLVGSEPAVSSLTCSKLAAGPYASLHSISDCELAVVLV